MGYVNSGSLWYDSWQCESCRRTLWGHLRAPSRLGVDQVDIVSYCPPPCDEAAHLNIGYFTVLYYRLLGITMHSIPIGPTEGFGSAALKVSLDQVFQDSHNLHYISHKEAPSSLKPEIRFYVNNPDNVTLGG
jgi:hypothetical protein